VSIKVMTWVWDQSLARGSQHHVLLAIADCASDDGSNAYPSLAELMRKTRLSERAVQYAIKGLVALGELFVSPNGGPKGCNRYRVVMVETPQIQHPADFAPPANPAPRKSSTPQDVRRDDADLAPGTVLEPSRKISSSKRSTSEVERGDVEQICRHLADRIEANGSKRPTVTAKWREAARLLLDRDGRTVEQVTRAIDWCQDDDFWRSNVLSMSKLRDQYDRLRLAAQRASPSRQSTTDQRVNAALALAEELERRQLS
jgi:hypothetical protein